ncbi:MAG: FAD-binding protein [Clostridia bacterium]|nr:FAD-binding protein [Clostridia bacterium]
MKKLLSAILAAALLLTMAVPAFAEDVPFEATIDWDAEYDVVVAGFGGAGAVSAITAADAGAKVLLLEKAPDGEAGGNTRYAAQILLTPTDREGAITYFKAMRGGYDNQGDDVIELIVDGSMAIPEWLVSMGADADNFLNYPLVEYPDLPGAEAISTTEIDKQFWTAKFWSLLFGNVSERAENIDVWYSAPAVRLIQDPATKIIHGVKVEQNGQTLNVRAKNGVVMAVGGFENNEEMIENYVQMPEAYSKGARYNTGDGVKMAIDVGADLWHMSTLSGPDINFVNPDTGITPGYNFNTSEGLNMFTGFARGSCLVVGGDGTRFINELNSPSHGHVNNHGTWVSQQIPNNSWMIYDSTNTRSVYLSFSEGNQEEIEKGWIIKADTLEELAEMMNIPADNLLATVEQYNGYCAQGYDPDFGADADIAEKEEGRVTAVSGTAEYLVPIEVGPFYAMPLKATFTNTQGGAKRNVECEVIDVWGDPIPHLYSAGEFGSFYCDIYNGGGNLAECVFSGRIAGANAAAVKTDVSSESMLKKEAYDGRSQNEFVTAENEFIGSAMGMSGDVVVKVTMDGDTITAVEVIKHGETEGIGDKAIAVVPGAIVEAQSSEVDSVSGATVTSKAIMTAVKEAVGK